MVGKSASRLSRKLWDYRSRGISVVIPCAGRRNRESVPRGGKVQKAVWSISIRTVLKQSAPSTERCSEHQVPQVDPVRIPLERVSRNRNQRTGCKSPCGGPNLQRTSVSLDAVRRYGDLATLSMCVDWRSQTPWMSSGAELVRSNRIPVFNRGAVARLKKLVNVWTSQGDAIGDP
jgi:hypothetical protein